MGLGRLGAFGGLVLIFLACASKTLAADAPLADAAEKGDRAGVRALIERRVDVNRAQVDGMTALHWAVYHDDLETVGRLVDAKADVKAANRYGVTPLSLACRNGNEAIVTLLLDAGADPDAKLRGDETPLMTAARTGKLGPVRALLARGADVNAKERRGQTSLMWAAAEGHAEVVEALLKAGADFRTPLPSGFTPLLFAAREGRTDVARILLKAGADVNEAVQARRSAGRAPARGTSPLIMAVENGHFELAALLLEAGADPNDQRSGFTALHTLTWVRKPNRGDEESGDPAPTGSGNLGSLEFVEKLVKHGADVNSRLKRGASGRGVLGRAGASPFLLAAMTADVPLMKLLVKLGADPRLPNAQHCTPLMAAAGVGCLAPGEEAGTEDEAIEAVKLALELGNDINAVDDNGETAMHGAAYKSFPGVVQLLADRGARIEVWDRANKYGWTPMSIAEGHRPGNFKPSAETIAALKRVSAGTPRGRPSGPGEPAASRTAWPGHDWETATPESQGLSGAAIDAAAAYAEKSGGGSGCIIRHGYLVKEWGDPKKLVDIKSATKGAVGATLLGLAVDAGLVGLDDLAVKRYPALGAERPENPRDRLDEITIRHLATMTAGFDDGRPPKLIYRPGTGGFYSNDGANMLAELLTLRFNEDLAAVFKRLVMDPIGAPPEEWAWRENSYRTKTINGLKSREFASGITITHRALARIGYLYLREGEWRGRRILSREFIRTATRPTDLPSFVPYYAFFWGSNGRGTFREMPNDAYWALGMGDSFVLACPSLDIVAVRLGVGSLKSQLPRGEDPRDWGRRVEGFFRLVATATKIARPDAMRRPPYPPSPAIKAVKWAPVESIVRKAKGGDNWPITWADDGHLYTSYGDGNGFEPGIPDKLSLGFARVEGGPVEFTGVNIRSESGEHKGDGKAGKKAGGMLMVDGVLYLWARNACNAQLGWSSDHARTWRWSDWRFTTSFGCPTFLNFGRNYADARDDYVYIYSHDSDDAYLPADRMVLARVPRGRIRDRDAYEFFEGRDARNRPTWTVDIARRGAVFTHQGRCYRSGISFDPGLKRYLWCQILPVGDPRFRGGFGIYDAPEPWGPWSTAFLTDSWDVGPGETSSIPVKWMSDDGKTVHLVFSGDDSFSVRKAMLETSDRLEVR